MNEAERNERWRQTVRLSLAVVAAMVLLIVFFLTLVEAPDGSGYPLGYVVAVSGLPLAGVLLVFWFIRRQERIDQRHGFYED
jgi:putative solute:sodium symporter small subunit